MKELIETKNIFLDSRNKTVGNFYDYTYSLNNGDPFFSCDNSEKMMVNLTTFQLNNDFYNMTSTNNQFGIGINTKLNPSTNPLLGAKISFTEGYYDVYNFIEEMRDIMSTEINDTFGDYEGTYEFTVNIEYIPNTSKLKWTITATNSFFSTYNMFFLFKDTVMEAGGDLELTGVPLAFLGFSSVDRRPAVGDGGIINSDVPINMVLQPTIFVKSNLVKDNKEYANDGSTQLLRVSNTLCIIDINVPKLSNIQYTDYNNNFETEAIKSINEINFRFVDEDNNIINFRSDSRISLKFTKYKDNHEIVNNIKKISELKESELLFSQMTTLLAQREEQRDIDILEEQRQEEQEELDTVMEAEELINEENIENE